jgi:multicomponent Na+:H+ antiporter subunit D
MSDILSYLILFLPLIASVFCFLINFKKSDFWIFISSLILIFLLTVVLGFNVKNQGVVSSNLSLANLSIPTGYYLDSLSIFFLLAIILARIFISIAHKTNIENSFNQDNRQLFYVVGLLNLFGIIGIFSSDNIFNLYIFIEIYCLTFCAIMAMSNDLNLSKIAFKYFCLNVSSSILLLLVFILLYLSNNSLQISEISANIEQKNNAVNWLLLPIILVILFKFFPLWLYFKKIKSQDLLAGFLLNFVFIINSVIGFYLLIRFLFYLFKINQVFIDSALIILGVLLVFWASYKIYKCQYLMRIAAFLAVINLGFVAISFGFFNLNSAPSLLYIANYILINLLFFSFANHLQKNFASSHIKHLDLLKEQSYKISIMIAFLMFLLLATPISLIFWANWYLILGSQVNIVASTAIILAIIVVNLVMVNLIIRIVNYSYFPNHNV